MALNAVHDRRKRHNVVEVVFHGIPFADFDRTGHWSTWSLLKMFEGSLLLSASLSPILTTATSKDEEYIILRQHCKISPQFYEDINIHTHFNPRIMFWCHEVGKTSLNMKVNLLSLDSDHVYATNIRKAVNFNMKTKKAVPNNTFYLEQAERINSLRPSFKWLTFPKELPTKRFTVKKRPLYSDTDYMNHVNNASYVKFCLDCCACAAQAKFYIHFEADFIYPVLDVDIQYLGESYANDDLEISTWQSTVNISDIYCIIRRKNKIIVKSFFRFALTKLDQVDYFVSRL